MNTLTYMTKIVRMIERECNTHKNVCDSGAHQCIFYPINTNFDNCNCGAIDAELGYIMNIG